MQPVSYDAERGILELRPSSPAYATQLRLFQQQLAKHLNGKLGRPAVRGIRVLAPGGGTAPVAMPPSETERPEVPGAEAPVRTRADGCIGYQDALAVALEHKPGPPPVNPYVEEAMRRQEAALRANRLPEDEHREAGWVEEEAIRKAGPVPGSMEASEAAARAYARSQAAGRTPRRAFDAA